MATVASATSINIGETYDTWTITGTTTVTNINLTGSYFPGRIITIIAAGAFAWTDTAVATATQGKVHLSAAYTMAVGDTLTLICGNNGDWYELARSVNG